METSPESLGQIGNVAAIAKASIFNTALPAAEANLLSQDITPTSSPSFLRIYAVFNKAGIMRVARTIGVTTITENLNDSISLKADAAYLFTIEWRYGDSINFRYSVTTGTIKILRAIEIAAAE